MKKFLLISLISLGNIKSNAQYKTADMQDSASQHAMVSFGPAIMNFDLGRGQSKSQTFYIVNKKNIPYAFNISMQDFNLDTLNNISYNPANSQPWSCADWITFDKNYIEVPPKSVGKIQISINVPDKPGVEEVAKWAMVNINFIRETDTAKKDKIKLASTTQFGVGTQIYFSPSTAQKDLQIVGFDKQDENTYLIKAKNTGKAILKCNISMELTAMQGDFKKTISHENLQILPEHTRFFIMRIPPNVPKGKYNAVAIVDAQDDEVPLGAAQKQIEIN